MFASTRLHPLILTLSLGVSLALWGCTDPEEIAESATDGDEESATDGDEEPRAACFPACIRDVNDDPETFAFDCTLSQVDGDGGSRPLPECDAMGEIPDDLNPACYVGLVGDAMSDECIDGGHNLEFRLTRREPLPEGTSLVAVCQISDAPETDCPNLKP